jgi:hypothetical protein
MKSSDKIIQTTLIDNSTYFSFKYSIQRNEIDADLVYNMANLLETLVFSEKILLAPTNAWKPDKSDLLFQSKDVECSQFSLENLSEEEIKDLYLLSLKDSISDIKYRSLNLTYGLQNNKIKEVYTLLKSWQIQVQNNPKSFIDTYSGAVFLTDKGSTHTLLQLNTQTHNIENEARHIAQYLLRTNVAINLLGTNNETCISYHPHSHRAKFVFNKLSLQSQRSMSLASTILNDASSEITKILDDKKKYSILSSFGAFQTTESDLPLILAVALSGATKPEDILIRAIELRNLNEAKRYRKWIGNLFESIASGNLSRQLEIDQELNEARKLLFKELNILYGNSQNNKVINRITNIGGAFDLEKLAKPNIDGLLFGVAKEIVKGASNIHSAYLNFKLKRKVALIITLAKERKSIDNLDPLLENVYKKKLSFEEKSKLSCTLLEQKKVFENFKSPVHNKRS